MSNLHEYADKLDNDTKTTIDADLANLKEKLNSEDKDAIKSITEALSQSSMKLGEAVYKGAQQASGDTNANAVAWHCRC